MEQKEKDSGRKRRCPFLLRQKTLLYSELLDAAKQIKITRLEHRHGMLQAALGFLGRRRRFDICQQGFLLCIAEAEKAVGRSRAADDLRQQVG